MVASNSLEAYNKLKPELSGKRRAVYEMFLSAQRGCDKARDSTLVQRSE